MPNPDILSTVEFAQEVAVDNAKVHGWRTECQAAWGTSFHVEKPTVRTVEQMMEAAEEKRASRKAFFEGPRGRFLQAVHELETLGFYEAESVRAIYSRAIADSRQPVDFAAIIRAVRILNEINHSLARQAIAALTEIGAPMTRAA